MTDQPGLFDVPPPPTPPPVPHSGRGRTRETWARTARAEVDAGFAAAWNRSADPHAPLHPIPGISWTPVGVDVEHLLRRPTRYPD